ncbi:hypothetical protein SAMN04488028_101328 [Reichenbachiella agariperforans]|uniref:Tetratricopeptide repeat protein n=1 Tax=Reichenbachiella agariperforans TaxID=156994 RepID=A0A1M6JUZ6_REIAG|nr:hypothetical protein [Reichenbachiella agariperforans]SHJ50450.1 hypothetical protein SAMN04488028_101328 [Reichenbachiella agariperforans]
MARNICFLFSALLVLSIDSFGQTFEFRVLANKGANKVQKVGTGEPVFLRTGVKLDDGDQITVGANPYVGLMHKSGQTLEVKSPGTMTVDELLSKLAGTDNESSNRYAKYVLKKADGSTDVNGNFKEAVHRANSTAISLMIPQSVQIFNPEIILRWNSVSDSAYYYITIKNIFDEEIYTAETDKTHLFINFNDENLMQEELITIKVTVKGNEELFSPNYGIERLPAPEHAKVQRELDEVKADIPFDSPLNKLILASFYEEKGLLLDAITQYEEIIEGSPDVDDFQTLYGQFLINNGLSKL